jgi:hypothetical protein
MKKTSIDVLWTDLRISKINEDDYICITDIAKYKSNKSDLIIQNWLRNRNTVEFLWLWEKINNPSFKPLEFEGFRKEAWMNAFLLSPKKWINSVWAIWLISKSGRYGWTYAHKDIAFEFASWISTEFKLYFIKEFQRLKEQEFKNLDWTAKRFLTKINYKIHTDSIKDNLIPKKLSNKEISYIYADEADILNKALFWITAQEWRTFNSDKKWNIRDYSNVEQLIVLANLESINSELIKMWLLQSRRLEILNNTAISQMKSLSNNEEIKKIDK